MNQNKDELPPEMFFIQRGLINGRFLWKPIAICSFVLGIACALPYFLWVDLVRHSFRVGLVTGNHHFLTYPTSQVQLEVSGVEFYILGFLQYGFIGCAFIAGICGFWGSMLDAWGYKDF